jgi:uncharacterized protein (TIGR02598 family)
MRALSANSSAHRRAFSLVEVALAVGVLAVALVGLFALMPSGLANFRTAMDISISAQIAQRVLQDAQQAEFDQLVDRRNLPADPAKQGYCPERFSFRGPTVKAPAWRYFDEQGTEIVPKNKNGELLPEERAAIVYQVNTRIRPRAELPTLRESGGQAAQVTVQVARNPQLTEMPIEEKEALPEHNLIKATNRIPIFTYSALIGKNQGQ